MTAATISISADAAPFTAARAAGLTFSTAALYAALAELPETLPLAELAALIGSCKRTAANGIKRLKDGRLIRETGRAGKTGRVAQYDTIHTGPGVAKLSAAGPAAAGRIDAEPQGPEYPAGPATRRQMQFITGLRREIIERGIKESRLREMVAPICDIDADQLDRGTADRLIHQLKSIKDNSRHYRRNRNDQGGTGDEPGRYRPAGPARRKRR